jgi:23S rRNA (adenine2503-C2)-methyltransferase
MAAFARGLDVVVNIIPWNPIDELGLDGIGFKEPSESEIQRFERMLADRRLPTTRRFKKGRGVSGACGQLGSTLTDGE